MERIKAFTLIEVVLAMMLAAIVIGMAYSAFTVFNKLYGGFREKNLAHADVRVLKQVMERDMENAGLIERSDGGIVFKNMLTGGTLDYSVGPDYLIRVHNAVPDTFKMKGLSFISSFEGNGTTAGIVDNMVLRFEHAGAPVRLSASKLYSSADLFFYQDSVWKR